MNVAHAIADVAVAPVERKQLERAFGDNLFQNIFHVTSVPGGNREVLVSEHFNDRADAIINNTLMEFKHISGWKTVWGQLNHYWRCLGKQHRQRAYIFWVQPPSEVLQQCIKAQMEEEGPVELDLWQIDDVATMAMHLVFSSH